MVVSEAEVTTDSGIYFKSESKVSSLYLEKQYAEIDFKSLEEVM